MADLDNELLLHQPYQVHIKAAHELRARYVAGLVGRFWTNLTGTKTPSAKTPTAA